MKRFLFLVPLAALALASCSNDELDEASSNSSEGTAIGFGTIKAVMTRATKAEDAASLGSNFVVEGYKTATAGNSVVFNDYSVNFRDGSANSTESNTSGWEYVNQTNPTTIASTDADNGRKQTIKYWDYSASQYDFAAYSLGKESSKATASRIDLSVADGATAYTLTGSVAQLAACYITDKVTKTGSTEYGSAVQLMFRSLGSKVRMAFYETIPGYCVKDIKFYSSADDDVSDGNPTLYSTSALPSGSGTMSVSYNSSGVAHVSYERTSDGDDVKTLTFSALSYQSVTDDKLTGSYVGLASNSATYTGTASETVLPNETGATLNLKVDYTLVATDGTDETITVTGATATIPAAYAKWLANYSYTYIFKISDKTNGSTGGSVVGLSPITLDAVVETNADGVQETITELGETAITTYSKGQVASANNEYVTGKNIYVVVGTGTELSATNAKLYVATVENSADQTITEASVENALKNGTNGVVTDKDGRKLTVVAATGLTTALTPSTTILADDAPDGNAITLNNAYFKASTAGTYVFEYTTGTDATAKKYYKVIKVVAAQ